MKPQSHPERVAGDPTTAEILIDVLIRWGVSHVFGMVGDGINPIIEALRKRKNENVFIAVRHEEAAGFMAGGFAKHTGKLGVCLRALSDLIQPDAVVSLDCDANTFLAARHLRLREGQRLTSPACSRRRRPDYPSRSPHGSSRQSIAVVGDGGFAMLMAELTTAVQQNLPIKIVVLKNNSLSEVRFEQQDLGNPPYGCDLGPIDFVAFAKACGADGFRCVTPAEVRPAITAALNSSRAAVVEAVVDPDEAPAKPEEVRG